MNRSPFQQYLDEMARAGTGYRSALNIDELFYPGSVVDEMRAAMRATRAGKAGDTFEWTYKRGTAMVTNRDGQCCVVPDAVRERA